MVKKRSRTSYTSKGQRRNVSKWARKAMKKERTPFQDTMNKLNAWKQGKNVMLTIANPVKSETNKPFIRVPAEQVWKRYER